MEVGISGWTWPWASGVPHFPQPNSPLTFMDVLERAKEYGVNVVQLDSPSVSVHELEEKELNRLSERARDYNITIELGTEGLSPEHLLEYLKIAKLLDAELVRTEITGEEVSIEKASERIRQVLNKFIDAGITIALENHEPFKADEWVNLVKNIDSPYVGICLDTKNNLGLLECPKRYIETLAPFAVNVHYDDIEIRRIEPHHMGFEIVGCPAGEGQIDIDFLLDQLQKQDRYPNLILGNLIPFHLTLKKTMEIESRSADKSINFLKKKCDEWEQEG